MKTYRVTKCDGPAIAVGQVLECDRKHFLVLAEPEPGLFECVPNDVHGPPFYLDTRRVN